MSSEMTTETPKDTPIEKRAEAQPQARIEASAEAEGGRRDRSTRRGVKVAATATRRPARRRAPARRRIARVSVHVKRETASPNGAAAAARRVPEQIVVQGLQLVRATARRRDLVGGVAHRALSLVSGSFHIVASTARAMESATRPPSRR